MLYEKSDILDLLVELTKKKDDKKKDKEKKSKCSCKKKKKKGGKEKKVAFHEKLALTIFFAPFVMALPFLFQTFNLLFLAMGSLYIQYAQWTLEIAKTFPH